MKDVLKKSLWSVPWSGATPGHVKILVSRFPSQKYQNCGVWCAHSKGIHSNREAICGNKVKKSLTKFCSYLFESNIKLPQNQDIFNQIYFTCHKPNVTARFFYVLILLCRSKKQWIPWSNSGGRGEEEVKTLWELHWRWNTSPKIYRSSPPNRKRLLTARSARTAGRRTSPRPWISICTALLPDLLLKHPQRPRRSWAGGIFTSTWKQSSSASWWRGKSWTTSTGHSASTSATTPPVWGTYPSASSRPPKLWVGKFCIPWLRALAPNTQSWFRKWRPRTTACLTPPAPPLLTSRSSRMWWWWPNSTAGLSTREPTGPRRPSPACTTRGRRATQRTPSHRRPGSAPSPLKLYASSSPSPGPTTGWCRKSVQTTTIRWSRTSSTLDDGLCKAQSEASNTDFSNILFSMMLNT